MFAIIVIISFKIRKEQAVEFTTITAGRMEQVAFIKDDLGKQIDLQTFIDEFKPRSFKVYKGKLGSTAHRNYFFYDSYEKLLFEMADIGNRNIIQINMDNNVVTYQYQ